MREKIASNGQAAVESLFAVIIMIGMLLVVMVIGLQQNQQVQALNEQQQKAVVCDYLAKTIESAGNSSEQINLKVELTRPVWIAKNSINFSPNQDDYYCYFNATVKDTNNQSYMELSPQKFPNGLTIKRNSYNEVVIEPFCKPLRCTTPDNPIPCKPVPDGCGGIYLCKCDADEMCVGSDPTLQFCQCRPRTCPENVCNVYLDDGCGGTIPCGDTCLPGSCCNNQNSTCQPAGTCDRDGGVIPGPGPGIPGKGTGGHGRGGTPS